MRLEIDGIRGSLEDRLTDCKRAFPDSVGYMYIFPSHGSRGRWHCLLCSLFASLGPHLESRPFFPIMCMLRGVFTVCHAIRLESHFFWLATLKLYLGVCKCSHQSNCVLKCKAAFFLSPSLPPFLPSYPRRVLPEAYWSSALSKTSLRACPKFLQWYLDSPLRKQNGSPTGNVDRSHPSRYNVTAIFFQYIIYAHTTTNLSRCTRSWL